MKHASVQATRLDVEGIHDSVVQLQDGEYRAVLEVSGSASRMEDDSQQEAVMAGFAAALPPRSARYWFLVSRIGAKAPRCWVLAPLA